MSWITLFERTIIEDGYPRGVVFVRRYDTPEELVDALVKAGMLKALYDKWVSEHSDRLINAIEANPRETGYFYTKQFDKWFTDFILRCHRPIEGEDYVVEGETFAQWEEGE